MANTNRLSRLMKMSWDIQRSKHQTRSKALEAAWAILSNEDVTVFYLVTRMSQRRPLTARALNQITLFPER